MIGFILSTRMIRTNLPSPKSFAHGKILTIRFGSMLAGTTAQNRLFIGPKRSFMNMKLSRLDSIETTISMRYLESAMSCSSPDTLGVGRRGLTRRKCPSTSARVDIMSRKSISTRSKPGNPAFLMKFVVETTKWTCLINNKS